MTSSTYVYTYVAFALVYLVSAFALVIISVRASGDLSSAARSADTGRRPAFQTAREYVGHGQHLVDYAQLATLLPLAYIVGSIFLGSAILRDTNWAGIANAIWVSITVLAIIASIMLVVRSRREAVALSDIDPGEAIAGERAADAAQRLGGRLGISTGLLALVTIFTMLNLWSVIANLKTLLELDYVL